jgi:hypothetical protein
MELRKVVGGWELWVDGRKAISVTTHGVIANENPSYIASWLPILAELIKKTR